MSKLSHLASDGTALFESSSQPKRRWMVFFAGLALGFILGAILL